ncbi:MAG: HEPN domain-containing protein [Peptococcaceae bacterium]|nr:HEPN domain-containing protein [Peptococcaceae bacterium]
MDANEKFEYWLDIARYDLETAEAMLTSKRWLYVVFMCQQAIEKLAKGLYIIYIDDEVPRIHNINAIISKYSDKLVEKVDEDTKEFFRVLSSYYLNNRYPEYITHVSTQISESEANRILLKSKEVFAWLLTLKP